MGFAYMLPCDNALQVSPSEAGFGHSYQYGSAPRHFGGGGVEGPGPQAVERREPGQPGGAAFGDVGVHAGAVVVDQEDIGVAVTVDVTDREPGGGALDGPGPQAVERREPGQPGGAAFGDVGVHAGAVVVDQEDIGVAVTVDVTDREPGGGGVEGPGPQAVERREPGQPGGAAFGDVGVHAGAVVVDQEDIGVAVTVDVTDREPGGGGVEGPGPQAVERREPGQPGGAAFGDVGVHAGAVVVDQEDIGVAVTVQVVRRRWFL